ncbi:GNAT family N-acetyltransferase [Erythrobacter sp. F6033]|uniref:GNAT family N-acetyltransferase n=1 Tax=Erythrobacter sp. F6033 TaxID=2926401 RepID=UPI001FF1A973|nr:GNAT family N-acetyltransferase [Erythrobacter sp. F6033]MCK0128243.1 GNAT family N-acetyltransferase [Erythrobacter sp. F6033]
MQDLATHAESPFDRVEWFKRLEETGLTPLIASATDTKQTAALFLAESNGRIASLRNWYSFTWRALTERSPAGDQAIRSIASRLKTRSHRVTLDQVPDEDGSATRLAHAFTAAGWRVEVTTCDTNHFLPVNGRTFSEYWADRPGRLRTTLKRKAKKVSVSIMSDFDPDAWEQYERIYESSWKPTEGHPDMLREYAKQEAAAGRLRLGMAFHEGEAIAAQFWTVENRIAYIHKLAHLESHKNLSAGTTLTAALFERVIDTDKVKLVDFGTGDQPYKADWMGGTRPRYQIDCLNMRSPKGWLDLGRLALGRLRAADVPELAREPRSG